MIIFTDILTNDELISDAFEPKLVDDIVYEADAAMITIKPGADVDIGANPAEGEEEEALEEGAEVVNNIVHSFKLQQTSFDKKSYLTTLKGYMKAVKEKLKDIDPEAVPVFEKNAQTFAKKVVANFKDYEFFIGESMDPDGMVVLLNYREDGTTPYLTFWKHGLKEVKV